MKWLALSIITQAFLFHNVIADSITLSNRQYKIYLSVVTVAKCDECIEYKIIDGVLYSKKYKMTFFGISKLDASIIDIKMYNLNTDLNPIGNGTIQSDNNGIVLQFFLNEKMDGFSYYNNIIFYKN